MRKPFLRTINTALFLMAAVLFVSSCNPNGAVTDDSLKKHFDDNKVVGSFGLWDNGQNKLTVYNMARFRDSAYLPASTFKIVNSLIALHTGRIFSDSVVIPWDGVTREITDWNKDMNMNEAFKVSNVPYYQEVARRIGKDTMQLWLDSLKYGTKRITTRIDTFWLDNSLRITSDEQLGLMKRLYFKQLPFNTRSQEIVKGMMLRENNANYKLSYKTGLGRLPNGHSLAWIVGWIEENAHVYFFVLNCEDKGGDTDMVTARMNVLKGILKQLGFFEGKK